MAFLKVEFKIFFLYTYVAQSHKRAGEHFTNQKTQFNLDLQT